MLSRFKNALYGPSTTTDNGLSLNFKDNDHVTAKRINVLQRSSSFREDLMREAIKYRINNSKENTSSRRGKLTTSTSTENIDSYYLDWIRDGGSGHNGTNYKSAKLPKYHYSRPEFLQLKTDDEILVSADHQIRPIILPRDVSRLPWKSGYAECINAGKSLRNEDQAACYQDVLIKKTTSIQTNTNAESDSNSLTNKLPWVYFGIFDGHAGTAVAVAAAAQLHNIIGEKLRKITDLLIALEFEADKDDESDEYSDCAERLASNKSTEDDISDETQSVDREKSNSTSSEVSPDQSPDQPPEQQTTTEQQLDSGNVLKEETQKEETQKEETRKEETRKERNLPPSDPETKLSDMIDMCRHKITVESLIIGALESAFWEMDSLIEQGKHDYKMPGGCTAIVSLFILGKLYVCNAGDSRAIVYKGNQVIPMSFDFTPTTERERILRLGLQHPEFLGNDFTHLEFLKKPTRKELGKQMLYKDAYMTGWSMKTITYDDLKFPLVWGEGKRSRVLATIGVTRGFGDHELRAQYGSLLIKPFLTPEPEVRVLPLENDDDLSPEDVLIMGTDGLWDVTSNQEAADVVKSSFDLFPDNDKRSKYRYITAAQDLVIHSRGHTTNWNNVWRTSDNRLASLDDIAVFVIPLKQYRDEYIEWKRLRCQDPKQRQSNMDQKQPSLDESINST